MHLLDLLSATPQKGLNPTEQLKLYRKFLGLTQAQLAAEMGTTQTSVGRWESGLSPISVRTMGHVRTLAAVKIGEEIRQLFADLLPQLSLCNFNALCGHPSAVLTDDDKGNWYFGAVFIDGYRKHSLHLRLADRKWYALDRQGCAVNVDRRFLTSVVRAAEGQRK